MIIQFSNNWNNKLCCSSFTTIRLYTPEKYCVGQIVRIHLNKNNKLQTDFGDAAIVEIVKIKIEQINEFIAHLDTGYSSQETKELIKKMYSNKGIDWRHQVLVLILLQKVKKQAIQTSMFS